MDVAETRAGWRRWPVRAAAGVILLAAAALLWPFAGWNWWPVLAGLGALILLYLLRLDRPLRGWAPHLAGLVTVALLAVRAGPWAWGIVVGLAALGVGLCRLPAWRVAAVGAVLTLACGLGYGVSQYRTAEEQHADQSAADTRYVASRSALPADSVLRSLTEDIASGDGIKACGLLGSPGRDQFAAATGAPDCTAAVSRLHVQVTDRRAYATPLLPAGALVKHGDTASVDGCAVWTDAAAAPGPRLGRFELRRYEGSRYLIVGYSPCP